VRGRKDGDYTNGALDFGAKYTVFIQVALSNYGQMNIIVKMSMR